MNQGKTQLFTKFNEVTRSGAQLQAGGMFLSGAHVLLHGVLV